MSVTDLIDNTDDVMAALWALADDGQLEATGYQLAQKIEATRWIATGRHFRIGYGSLYRALDMLVKLGYVETERRESVEPNYRGVYWLWRIDHRKEWRGRRYATR